MEDSEIGIWSEAKLHIIREYATAYSTILSSQGWFSHIYIDAFSGPGIHRARRTGEFVPGSPLNALDVKPPFTEYYFIDLDKQRIQALESEVGAHHSVHVYHGDCNEILLRDIFPNVTYRQYRRALCLLDPYGLHLKWEVIQKAADLGTVEIFLNFPILDMNRNVLVRDPQKMDARQIERMNAFWGDNTWREVAYATTDNLFGYEEKVCTNDELAEAFQRRLINVAGFAHVPKPVYMRNSMSAGLYYLFFASQRPVAKRIISSIFEKYRLTADQRLF